MPSKLPQNTAAPTELVKDFAARVNEVEDERIDLARAALTIARTEYPGLDPSPYIAQLEDLASRVRRRIMTYSNTQEILRAINGVLYEEEQLKGNTDEYFDPRNSFLNQVLERRLGIPITLALIYAEVSRRVELPLHGVGMPGHFLLKHYDTDGRQTIIDPFSRGVQLTPQDCQRRLDQIYAGQMSMQPEFLAAVSKRQWLTRLLNNLKTIYLSGRNFRKALPIVDLILAIYPRSPEDVKQRAALRYNLGQLGRALQDFENYLKMSPEASDGDEIRHVIMAIRRTMASWN